MTTITTEDDFYKIVVDDKTFFCEYSELKRLDDLAKDKTDGFMETIYEPVENHWQAVSRILIFPEEWKSAMRKLKLEKLLK